MVDQPDIPDVFSCDVEDWEQAYFHSDRVSERCYANTMTCLEVLAEHGVKGTFFVQGMVAEQRPEVVRAIQQAGHDIQTHGHLHKLTWDLGPQAFKQDLERSVKLLEDIIGVKVTGYRAPCFSINRETFWAFDAMAECGLTFDSSLFPMRMRRYGLRWEPGYSQVRGLDPGAPSLDELPVSVVGEGALRLPVGGGGYMRLWPGWLLRRAYERVRAAGRPFVYYCHPYEFDPGEFQKMGRNVPLHKRVTQQAFRDSVPAKLAMLFARGRFATMPEAIAACRQHHPVAREVVPQ
ncbi:MAG: polysaccharide deacetylase family protein [Phycisphaeraceae bacterium]